MSYSKPKTASKNGICADCIHFKACSAWNIGDLYNADTTRCVNYERIETDMRIVKAIALFKSFLTYADNQKWTFDPLGYALYQTWKELKK